MPLKYALTLSLCVCVCLCVRPVCQKWEASICTFVITVRKCLFMFDWVGPAGTLGTFKQTISTSCLKSLSGGVEGGKKFSLRWTIGHLCNTKFWGLFKLITEGRKEPKVGFKYTWHECDMFWWMAKLIFLISSDPTKEKQQYSTDSITLHYGRSLKLSSNPDFMAVKKDLKVY